MKLKFYVDTHKGLTAPAMLLVKAMHWLPIVILSVWILAYWLPNMKRKDRSLARYEDFESYRRRTKLFIPYLI